MSQSKYKRPPGFEGTQSDPEESYRAGYQHSVRVMMRYLEANKTPDMERLKAWIDTDLTQWRHDIEADPVAPSP
ncbi:hypothetical protein RSK20926_22059 [Roseobacter sp. SK209-2-6]|uniref:hypothetical protein n=1 Tax=Roseobacter sp. SK209-2-6 TaxID=388739 RepID=UPI0000F3F40D|nr:hypothetical protein [Roseobacter sp. SK209-2-6]EBA16455.1 hypothetical protein RSK20926_22059 [Roseobacter sp. SK209-2-6]